jgi:hypothetical protein
MRRRFFLGAAFAAGAAPALAQTTTPTPAPAAAPATTPTPQGPIDPVNALEYAFVQALTDARMRPVFRQYLVNTHVVLALTSAAQNSAPLEVEVRDGFRAVAIFTSAQRVDEVLGADAPRIVINGRAAFERAAGKNVVINYRLVPMLTLEPSDVAAYIAAAPEESSAGPTE